MLHYAFLAGDKKTSAVSRDSLSPPSFSGGESAKNEILSQAKCGTSHLSYNRNSDKSINVSVQQSVSTKKKKNELMPSGIIYVCECVCIKARNWNNALFSMISRDILHSSIISENIHSVVLRRITSSAVSAPPPPSSLYLKALPTKSKCVFFRGGTGWSSPKPPVRMSPYPNPSLVVERNPACEWVSDQVFVFAPLPNESNICFTAPGRTAPPQGVCHRGLFYIQGVRSDPF